MNTLSAAGLDFIRRNESCSLTPYPDPPGQTVTHSIGYGHLIGPGESFTAITPLQAMTMLLADLRVYCACVNQHVTAPITQPQFDALVDFTYNEGCGALIGSTVLKELNAGNYGMAADALLDWDKDMRGGMLIVDDGLLARRQAERTMFLSDLPPEPDA